MADNEEIVVTLWLPVHYVTSVVTAPDNVRNKIIKYRISFAPRIINSWCYLLSSFILESWFAQVKVRPSAKLSKPSECITNVSFSNVDFLLDYKKCVRFRIVYHFSLLPILSRFTMEQKSGLCLNISLINIHELSTNSHRFRRLSSATIFCCFRQLLLPGVDRLLAYCSVEPNNSVSNDILYKFMFYSN